MREKKRATQKVNRQEKPAAAPRDSPTGREPRSEYGGALQIEGGGAPIYLNAATNDPSGAITGDGQPTQISGSLDHTPDAEGMKYLDIPFMVIGRNGQPLPAPYRITPTGRFIAGLPIAISGRRCMCGFQAFAWQRICPRCARRT